MRLGQAAREASANFLAPVVVGPQQCTGSTRLRVGGEGGVERRDGGGKIALLEFGEAEFQRMPAAWDRAPALSCRRAPPLDTSLLWKHHAGAGEGRRVSRSSGRLLPSRFGFEEFGLASVIGWPWRFYSSQKLSRSRQRYQQQCEQREESPHHVQPWRNSGQFAKFVAQNRGGVGPGTRSAAADRLLSSTSKNSFNPDCMMRGSKAEVYWPRSSPLATLLLTPLN